MPWGIVYGHGRTRLHITFGKHSRDGLLWVADDAKNADHVLRVSQSLQGKVESELFALRAVELLRGKLLPVPSLPGSNSAAPNPSSPADEPLPPMVDPGAPAMVGSLRSLDGLVFREKPADMLPPAIVGQEKLRS